MKLCRQRSGTKPASMKDHMEEWLTDLEAERRDRRIARQTVLLAAIGLIGIAAITVLLALGRVPKTSSRDWLQGSGVAMAVFLVPLALCGFHPRAKKAQWIRSISQAALLVAFAAAAIAGVIVADE